jgi:hypothetical protein
MAKVNSLHLNSSFQVFALVHIQDFRLIHIQHPHSTRLLLDFNCVYQFSVVLPLLLVFFVRLLKLFILLLLPLKFWPVRLLVFLLLLGPIHLLIVMLHRLIVNLLIFLPLFYSCGVSLFF